jgi:rubrerythrin
VEVAVRCRKCGAVPQLVGKQYTTRCPSCGTVIQVTPERLMLLKLAEYKAKYGQMWKPQKEYECGICQDRGYLVISKQVNDQLADFAYRCICQRGQERQEAWPVVPAELVAKPAEELEEVPF